MLSKKKRNLIFLEAFMLLLVVFLLNNIINFYLDEKRENDFDNYVLDSDTQNFIQLSSLKFSENFKNSNENYCDDSKEMLIININKTKDLIENFDRYNNLFNFNNKQNSLYLREEIYINQFDLYTKLKNYNEKCFEEFIYFLFFIDSEEEDIDTRQFLIFKSFEKENNNSIVMVFDKEHYNKFYIDYFFENYNLYGFPNFLINDYKKDFSKKLLIKNDIKKIIQK